jgi:hypothetical protein
MPKLMVHVVKEIHAYYEVNPDTDDVAMAQRVETEKLRSYEYEEMLNLNCDLDEWPAAIIEVYHLDEAA